MKQIIIKSISIVVLLVLFGYGAYIRILNPDMTDMRRVITYWKEYLCIVLGMFASGIIFSINNK